MKQAERCMRFIEQFCTLGGSFRGQPFILADFQKDIIEAIYEEDETGKRKVRTALIGIPRKNGKSLLSSALAVYSLIADDRDPTPLVVCAAADRQQARLVHDECKRIIQDSSELFSVCQILRNEIRCTRNNGLLRVISADAGSAQGLGSTHVFLDEKHVFKDDDLYQALQLGSAARNEPLFINISTAGYDLESPLGRMYNYGLKVNSGEIKDDSFKMIWHGPELLLAKPPAATEVFIVTGSNPSPASNINGITELRHYREGIEYDNDSEQWPRTVNLGLVMAELTDQLKHDYPDRVKNCLNFLYADDCVQIYTYAEQFVDKGTAAVLKAGHLMSGGALWQNTIAMMDAIAAPVDRMHVVEQVRRFVGEIVKYLIDGGSGLRPKGDRTA
jgi:hypothetical protein